MPYLYGSMHKSGFISIVGKPNVGKSTLLNAFIGEELSIVNPKAQTTRHRIKGILNHDDYQIIFSDTPGIMKSAYKLHDRMLKAVNETFEDADLVLFVTEVKDRTIEEELRTRLMKLEVPLYVIINKVDTSDQEGVEEASKHWQELLNPKAVFPISALHKFYVDVLLQNIVDGLPEGPAYYGKDDELSDRNTRFFVSEIIRERVLHLYQKEVPYAIEVIVTDYKESETIDRIYTTIYCERESQKAILLGHHGAAIKKLGVESRKKIEELVGKQVYLELTVKVADDWRNDDRHLRNFGYDH
jgi:GTP-binding protein Era